MGGDEEGGQECCQTCVRRFEIASVLEEDRHSSLPECHSLDHNFVPTLPYVRSSPTVPARFV